MKKTLLSISIASILATSIGCGGSGGGSSNNNDDDTTPGAETTTLSGKASKGIIQFGVVTAYELNATGDQIRSVGSETTGEDGSYSLTLSESYSGGPIQLVITATDSTKMKCDAFNGCGTAAFGTPISLPDGFAMNAIVAPIGSGSTISTQITPLSHMATARALNNGTVNAEAIANAISETSQIVGSNIQNTEIVDITDPASLAGASETAKQLALVNAGLAEMIIDGGSDINSQLSALAASFADGQFGSGDDISIEAIVDSISEAVDGAAANANVSALLESASNKVDTLVQVINSQTNGGSYNPEPSDNAAAGEISIAKSLISNARTLIDTITSNYDSPMDALDIDAQTAESVLNADSAVLLDLAGEAIAQALDDLDAEGINIKDLLEVSQRENNTEIRDDENEIIGQLTATLTDEGDLLGDGISITLNGSITGDTTVTISDLKLLISIDDEDLTFDEEDSITAITLSSAESISVSGTLANNKGTSLSLNDVALGFAATSGNTIELDGEENDSEEGSVIDSVTAITFSGDASIAANDSTFDGIVSANLVALNNPAEEGEMFSPAALSLSGTFSGATSADFEASATLNIRNAAEFDVFGYLSETSYASSYELGNANELFAEEKSLLSAAVAAIDSNASVTPNSIVVDSNPVETEISFGVSYAGLPLNTQNTTEYQLWDQMLEKVLTSMIIAGESDPESLPDAFESWEEVTNLRYVERNDSVTISYRAPRVENDAQYIDALLTVTSSINTPDLAAANITTSLDRTGLETGEFDFTISSEGQSFTIAATGDTEVDSFTISNPDGAAILVTLSENDDVEGSVSVNGVNVGTIETLENGLTLVRFTDGSFESLY